VVTMLNANRYGKFASDCVLWNISSAIVNLVLINDSILID
jgi:hypothetical protein